MKNEKRRHAMKSVEVKRSNVVMKLRVDGSEDVGPWYGCGPRRCAAEAQSDVRNQNSP